jgi:hypothetical protein
MLEPLYEAEKLCLHDMCCWPEPVPTYHWDPDDSLYDDLDEGDDPHVSPDLELALQFGWSAGVEGRDYFSLLVMRELAKKWTCTAIGSDAAGINEDSYWKSDHPKYGPTAQYGRNYGTWMNWLANYGYAMWRKLYPGWLLPKKVEEQMREAEKYVEGLFNG